MILYPRDYLTRVLDPCPQMLCLALMTRATTTCHNNRSTSASCLVHPSSRHSIALLILIQLTLTASRMFIIIVPTCIRSDFFGCRFLGHSGQPLDSMMRYISINDNNKIELLEKTLHWRHMVPTAPDSIACMSFAASDPFVITESPHIYFSGNADSYQTKVVTGTNDLHINYAYNLISLTRVTCPTITIHKVNFLSGV